MALTSTRRRLWILALLIVVLVLLLLPDKAWSKPGEYFSASHLINKRLPKALASEDTGKKDECQKICSKHPQCDAFAVSEFEGKCNLYERVSGTKPVKYNTYTLYVLRRRQEDGYYVFGSDYYRLYLKRLNALDAAEYCKSDGGSLAAVKNETLNEKLRNRLLDRTMSRAYIGVSDMKQEEQWVYSDGTPMTYSNWDWNKKWEREDLDCALLTISGKWEHGDCWNKNFFFCLIPMF